MSFFNQNSPQKRCSRGELPGFVCDYVSLIAQKPHKLSIQEARFVVFDTETTGFDFKKDRVINIGAVALKGGEIWVEDSLELMLRQDSAGGSEAVSVHQIMSKELHEGLEEEEALKVFLEYIRGDVLVAHYAAFDIQMMSALFQNHFGLNISNACIDTIALSQRIELGKYHNTPIKQGEYTLDALCKRYHIQITSRHKAAGDALATARLFQILLHQAPKKGIKTVKQLLS